MLNPSFPSSNFSLSTPRASRLLLEQKPPF
uniref:Uncharacterized protein n=1 Tax=Rhizophora mucronata TaxID=61149 RepID=A0A2P2PUQ5_RHIMU